MTEATGIVGEFFSLKEETDADLLTMQCGDFYEFFGEDARLVNEELDLKISEKSSHGSTYPMAGVPVDDLTPYVQALVERGYRVAVADQYETDSGHAREITRVVTPGTLLETTDAEARYLAAIVRGDEGGSGGGRSGRESGAGSGPGSDGPDATYGLAFADVTTGRFLVTTAGDRDAALSECYRFDPAELLPGPDLRNDDGFLEAVRERGDATLSLHDGDAFAPGRARHVAGEQFGAATLSSVGIDDEDAAVRAAGAVVDYVDETGAGVLASMTRLQRYSGDDRVDLDATTQRNLELTETMGDGEGALVDVIDHTRTSAGGRLLREWLTRPVGDCDRLDRRHDAVDALAAAALARDRLRETLGEAYDLERLASRAASGSADAEALLSLRDTLGLLPELAEAVESDPDLADSPVADVLEAPDREAARELRERLDAALSEDPPSTVTEGGLFQRGYDDELDELIERHEELQEYFDTLADRVKRETGLTHVTVDRNKTDGYYVQVGKSEADGVPERFDEIKTLKNARRYTTDELDEKEREILRVEERRADLEYDLFCDLRERVAGDAELLQDVGRALARLDVLATFAVHAVENDWTRPALHDGDELAIEAGRHPVVEQTVDFVPNDARLDEDRSFLIVTGPNMSGKSTYMRQVALIVLLAQVGSFVPADDAEVGLVDGIYTRVGALDELAQGRSTFMVEMQELSNILHSATDDSLVILDEVGRGTATFDGMSIAWAATEYLHNEVGAETLFATHYHELTTLADHLPRVENVHVAADERDGDVTFLRTVREGPTDRSYGIHVADLAGVPDPVVDRSREVLERLREDEAVEARGGTTTQQVVFDVDSGTMRTTTADGGTGGDRTGTETAASGSADGSASTDGAESDGRSGDLDPEAREVIEQVRDLEVDETPPVELMAKVQEWQERLDGDP